MQHKSSSYRLKLWLLVSLMLGALVDGFIHRPHNVIASTPAPIVLLTSATSSNPFGLYLGEILRAEGFNTYEQHDIASINASQLQNYSIAVLAEMSLTPSQADMLTQYVENGGNLIAMRPDSQLESLFGVTAVGSSQNNGYIRIQPGTLAGAGLYDERIQIHGKIDRYNQDSAITIAKLYNGTTDTNRPAVTFRQTSGGKAAMFAFDLARTVVLMRQGNPNNADVDIDGDGILRTVELFQSPGNGPRWNDLSRIAIPQADELMRLFGHLLEDMSSSPMPRLWYFPEHAKTILVLTGDAHGNPQSYFNDQIASIEQHGGKITLYLSIASDPSSSSVQQWTNQGHTFGIHTPFYKPDSYPPYNITSLAQGYDVYSGTDGNGGWWAMQHSVPKSRTTRNHQVAWKGWTAAA